MEIISSSCDEAAQLKQLQSKCWEGPPSCCVMFLKSDTRGSSPEGRKATALIGEFGERTRPPWPAFHSASNGPFPTDEGCGFPSQPLGV